jgi:excinuclease ABC subunit C
LAHARDEAHRAANLLRVKLGKSRVLTSDLDAIEGVGAKTRQKLLRKLGSLSAVRAASESELIAAGATRKQARAIASALGERADDESQASEVAPEATLSQATDEVADEVALDNAFKP